MNKTDLMHIIKTLHKEKINPEVLNITATDPNGKSVGMESSGSGLYYTEFEDFMSKLKLKDPDFTIKI